MTDILLSTNTIYVSRIWNYSFTIVTILFRPHYVYYITHMMNMVYTKNPT